MTAIRRRDLQRIVRRTYNAALAADAVGLIVPGCEIFGLTKGQFSLAELLLHCLDTTGPAHATIATWTVAGADIYQIQQLQDSGRLVSCRWLVDFSFPARQPGFARLLREAFGDDAIACTASHAKFMLLRNDSWNLVIRTSMNLNLNRRLETWEISDDRALADWIAETVAACFEPAACTIGAAVEHPAAAQTAINYVGGRVENRPPRITYGEDHGRRISYQR